MTTQYTPILKLALPVTGELSGTWGTVVNDNITSMVEQAVAGLATISTWTANAHTLTTADGTTSESRCAMLVAATGSGGTALTAAGEIICPAASKLYVLKNGTSYAITLKTSGGTGVAVPAGDTAFLFCDGTNVNACVTTVVNGHISGNLTVDGNTTLGDANTDTVTVNAQFNTDLLPSTDNARDLGSTAKSWRTLYCDTSVLTPNLQVTNIKANDGTAAIVLTDSTGAVGISTAVTMSATTQNIALGTSQTSGTFTVGGAAQTGTQTFDQSTKTHTLNIGAGATESAATKTINIGTGGVATSTTAIAIGSTNGTTITLNGTVNATTVNVTTLDLTNLEVTNIKAKDGTAAMSIADSTGVVSITANPVLSGGTANGVTYLNGSKVLTSGSALTFDGTSLTATGKIRANNAGVPTADVGFVTINGYQGTSAANGGFAIAPTTGGGSEFYTHTGAVGSESYTERMRITSTGTVNIVGGGTPGSTQAVSFNGSAPQDSLVLNSSGNLGVGTASPGSRLAVFGSANMAYFYDGTTSDLQFQVVSSATVVGTTTPSALKFKTSNTERLTLDSSGNLGLGVTPSAWSVGKAFEVGFAGNGIWSVNVANTYVVSNVYYASSAYRYAANGYASAYEQENGIHKWRIAASGLANDPITFTQAMTLDASGNLALGTTSTESGVRLWVGNSAAQFNWTKVSNSLNALYAGVRDTGEVGISSSGAYPILFYTSGNERARITSGGDLAVGRQSSIGGARVSGETSTGNPTYAAYLPTTGTETAFLFVNPNGTVGSITTNGSATAYNTSSDYRLKNITGPITNSGAYIDSLNPVEGTWKADGSTFVGLIAHEVQEASRTNVATGVKDGPEMQGMDYSNAELIANLIAEVKSLRARVAALEAN